MIFFLRHTLVSDLDEKSSCPCFLQGDTTSALAAALAAFYSRVKVGHVEAGLMTEDRFNPFPEKNQPPAHQPAGGFELCPDRESQKKSAG